MTKYSLDVLFLVSWLIIIKSALIFALRLLLLGLISTCTEHSIFTNVHNSPNYARTWCSSFQHKPNSLVSVQPFPIFSFLFSADSRKLFPDVLIRVFEMKQEKTQKFWRTYKYFIMVEVATQLAWRIFELKGTSKEPKLETIVSHTGLAVVP